MPEEKDNRDIREAVVRAVLDAGISERTTLDDEDREMLVSYGTGKISRDEMMQFFRNKAARIEAQIHCPQ